MKSALLAGAWLGTLVAVFLVGRSTSPESPAETATPPPREPPMEVPREAPAATAGAVAEDAHLTASIEPEPGPAGAGPAARPEFAPREAPAPARPFTEPELPEPGEPLEFTEASKTLRAYVAAQFARGEEGTMEIVRALDRLVKGLRKSRVDDRQAVRELYPWIKFLVEHESETVDFLQSLLRLIGEDPTAFSGIDDNVLEVFLEPFPMVLPGVISEERLSEFRALAQKILAMPQDQLPDSVRKNVRRLERAVTFAWAQPIDADAVGAAIRAGTLQPGQALLALRQVDLMELDRSDRTALIGMALGTGNYEAIRALEKLPPGSVDVAVLDGAVLEGLRVGQSPYILQNYLAVTGRKTWSEVRPLVDLVLSTKPDSAEVLAWLVNRLQGEMRPDATWVQDFLVRYELKEPTRERLKQTYDLR